MFNNVLCHNIQESTSIVVILRMFEDEVFNIISKLLKI